MIITDNFNIYQIDRTLWYTINYVTLEKLMVTSEPTTDQATPSISHAKDKGESGRMFKVANEFERKS